MHIDVIGLGLTVPVELGRDAQAALTACELVVGSARQRAALALPDSQSVAEADLPALSELEATLHNWQAQGLQRVALLASGDPLCFGIGRWLRQHWPTEQIQTHPHISSVQGACHAVGISLQDAQLISCHGRPLSDLNRWLQPNRSLICLTDAHSQPEAIAERCLAAGLVDARLTVCERLGYPEQVVRDFTASELVGSAALGSASLDSGLTFDPLHVTVITTGARVHWSGEGVAASVIPQPAFPGIDERWFITESDVNRRMLTKRSIRLQVLSLLQTQPAEVVWDLGAGCGSVAVEIAYWQPSAKVCAVEVDDSRRACISANAERFGVSRQLQIVGGRAEQQLESLPNPDAVFIGGSDGALDRLLAMAWARLPIGGRLVATAVIEPTRIGLYEFDQWRQQTEDADTQTLQLTVSKSAQLGEHLTYRPTLPVTLYCWRKLR